VGKLVYPREDNTEILTWRGFQQDARKTGSINPQALPMANQSE
jgi:hypothetical protein